ncbi:unnamed protein product [Rotaria magnacalcarata]
MLFLAALLYLTLISIVNAFVCTNDGLFANPLDIHSFYQCASGTPHLMPCPAGLVCNSDGKLCDWKPTEPIVDCVSSQKVNCRATTRWATNGHVIVGVDSESGRDSQHLNAPGGIFIDTRHGNNVYVVDGNNYRVQKFLGNSLASDGITVAGGNGYGSNPDQLKTPVDAYVDANENVHVGDSSNHRIQMWPKGATSGFTAVDTEGTGEYENRVGYFHSMFFHEKTNTFYLPDVFKKRVVKFVNGSNIGTVVVGQDGDEFPSKILYKPTGVFVHDCETLYVADAGGSRIQKFLKGSTDGITVAGDYQEGSNVTQFKQPWSIKVDQYNNMYIVDTFNGRIHKWGPNDNAGVTIIGGNGFGDQLNQLWFSYYMALDSEGNIFITDYGNHRVQKFDIQPEISSC